MHKLFIPKRVREIKKELKRHDASDFGHFEGVYRCYHGSFKIEYIRGYAINFLRMSLYILGLINYYESGENSNIKDIKKCLFKNTTTYNILQKMIKNNLPQSRGWIPIHNHIIPYCGYYHFFKTILESLIKYAETRTGDEPYRRMINYYEGVSEYFIGHLRRKDEKK